MNYRDIKDFNERCNSHPDHQKGMITGHMLKERLHEEVEELRAYIELDWSSPRTTGKEKNT